MPEPPERRSDAHGVRRIALAASAPLQRRPEVADFLLTQVQPLRLVRPKERRLRHSGERRVPGGMPIPDRVFFISVS